MADSSDACPTVPGPAPSGCPANEDSDGDGVPNASDACPMVAGAPPDGCPATVFGLPFPVPGQTANLLPLSGEVFVRLPAGLARRAPARGRRRRVGRASSRSSRPARCPSARFVDTDDGAVRLATAQDFAGTVQFGQLLPRPVPDSPEARERRGHAS